MDKEIEELSRKLEKERSFLEEKASELVDEKELSIEVEEEDLNLSIAGVDGGICRKKLRGIELVITRSCLVEMTYRENKLKEYLYYPNPNPDPTLHNYELEDNNTKKPHLLRMNEEITTALEYIETEPKADVLILDGSIIPNPHSKPKNNSEEREDYELVVSKYEKLFKKSSDKGIQLIGAIEDSKSRKISKKKGIDSLDNLLLYHILRKNQRTSEFNYSDQPGEHPVLTDFSREIRNKIKFMYLKPVEGDTPLRIEYLDGQMSPDKIASAFQEISKVSNNYSYPIPLIEADLHAKLTEKETDLIIQRIKNQAGENPALKEKRRNVRPFH
ncbi:MAG: DNA double-strand break repair nuclease NurA [archaeon]